MKLSVVSKNANLVYAARKTKDYTKDQAEIGQRKRKDTKG